MNFVEEAKKEYETYTKKEQEMKDDLKLLQQKIRPLKEYLKSIGVIERKKRSRPQPAPLQG